MKKILFTMLLALLFSLGINSCKKHSNNPVDQLPPATQTGANTLGFLLNGEVWTPKGNNGTKNLSWYYDPSYAEGSLSISTYRILSDANREYFGLGGSNISHTGMYPIFKGSNALIDFTSLLDSCFIDAYDSSVYRNGELTITKLDTVNGIISGTFWANLYKLDCVDTLKITNGRFDLGQ